MSSKCGVISVVAACCPLAIICWQVVPEVSVARWRTPGSQARHTAGGWPDCTPLMSDRPSLELPASSHTVPRLGVSHQLVHSTAAPGGAFAQPQGENQLGKHCWCPLKSLKHQVAQCGNQNRDSPEWKTPYWWHRSLFFGSEHVSFCPCSQYSHFLLMWKDID